MTQSIPVQSRSQSARAQSARATTAPTVREFRHRREMPLIVLAAVLTVTAAIVFIALAAAGQDEPAWLSSAVVMAIVAPALAALIFIRFSYWRTISNAVEVTPKQFPEVPAIFTDLAGQMGMTPDGAGMAKQPRLYVVNGMGEMNAYATKCRVRRGYVVINSDLLDVAYFHGHFDTLRFVLAHELGHIKCGHVDIKRMILIPVSTLLLLRQSVSRAQEYTADRVGSFYAPEGALGLMALFAGKHIGEHVDRDAYFESVAAHQDGFWLKLANFRADHAVGFRRMVALRRVQTDGWDVHGQML